MNDQPDIEVLRDLWLARFGMEWVYASRLRSEPFWDGAAHRLALADRLLAFGGSRHLTPLKYRLREKQLAPSGATTKE
jgi:hypothetical protein